MAMIGTEHWARNLVLMWFSQLLVLAGFDAVIPFIPLYLGDQFGITDTALRGIYVSIFFFASMLAYAIFCPIWGSLSDRYGVKIMLLRGSFLTAIFFPMMAYVDEPWMLIGLRFLTAACAGTTVAAQTLIVKTTPENRQGFALGLFSTAVWAGAMLGNTLGGLIAHYYGYKSTFWFCGILYFISGIFVLFAKDAPKAAAPPPRPNTHAAKVHRYRHGALPGFTYGVWLMLFLLLLLRFARQFEVPYSPMLIEEIIGTDKAAFWTGIIGAFVSVGAMMSGFVIGYLADRLKPQIFVIPALAMTALLIVIQAVTDDLFTYGWSRTLTYFFGGGLFPVFQKVLAGATPQRKRGSVFGWSTTFSNVGAMMSTCFAGWVIVLFGIRGVFMTAALITIALIPISLWCITKAMNQPFYLAHSMEQFGSKKKKKQAVVNP